MYKQKILIEGYVTVNMENEIGEFESLDSIKEDLRDDISMMDFGDLRDIDYEIEETYGREALVKIIGHATIKRSEIDDYIDDYFDYVMPLEEAVRNISTGILDDDFVWEIEQKKDAKKEDSYEEKESDTHVEEAPAEKVEEPKEEPEVIENIKTVPEEDVKEHIDEEGLKSGRMNVYVEGKEYEVELDTEKDSETAVSEYNNTVNDLIDKYNIDMEGK